jgi:hypothetical protein
VVDYYWAGLSEYGCGITLGTCEAPSVFDWTEPDGAKEWRKVCGPSIPAGGVTDFPPSDGVVVDASSGCKFEALFRPLACENHDDASLDLVVFDTLDQCFAACQDREDCGAVLHKPELTPGEFECELHLSTCNAPMDYVPEDVAGVAQYYQKSCAGADTLDAGATP